MKLERAYELFEELQGTIRKFEDRGGSMPEEFDGVDYDNPDDVYRHNTARVAVDMLDSVSRLIDWANKPILAEGRLTKNSEGRYEIEDTDIYFTSGSLLDYWDEEDEEWCSSRVEHNGQDYFVVLLGREKNLEGVKVRAK